MCPRMSTSFWKWRLGNKATCTKKGANLEEERLEKIEIQKWKDESGMQHATRCYVPYFIMLPSITKRDGLFGRNATVLVGVIIDDLETPVLLDSFNIMFGSWTCEFYSYCSWSHCWRHFLKAGIHHAEIG